MIDATKLKEFLSLKDETPNIEFKLKYVLIGDKRSKFLDELSKDVIALANTAGRRADDFAYLIIGAGDKLNPDGTRDKDDVRPYNYSRKFFIDTVNPRCHPPIPNLNYEEIEVDGNYYGVLEIPPSPHTHELSRDFDTPYGNWKRGSVPIRRGDQVGVASPADLRQMMPQKESWSDSSISSSEQFEELLVDETKLIKVRKLVIAEAKKLYAALNDSEFLKKDNDQRYDAIAERIEEYEGLTETFLSLFVMGCHSGGEWLSSLWAEAITIIGNVSETTPGASALLRLRRYPALLLLYAGGTAAIAGENYANLTALLKKSKARIFGQNRDASISLVPGRVVASDDEKHLKKSGSHRMPFNFHISNFLKENLKQYIHSDENFMDCFVRFEYLYALFSESQGNGLIAGSFTWESEQMKSHERYFQSKVWIIKETDKELEQMGAEWYLLKSGLFNGSLEEFKKFKKEVDEKVERATENFFRR